MKYKRGYYDLFVQACAKYSSQVAVRVYEEGAYRCFSYSELYGVCEYIAQQLQQLGSPRGVVGLVCRTNIIVPCVIAAVHKCCTTFMFLDPLHDIKVINEDVKFSLIISIMHKDESLVNFLYKKPDKTVKVFGMYINFYDYSSSDSNKSILEHSYIAMTSGSTGEAKKVQVPMQCIMPNIEDLTSIFQVTSDDVIYFSTPLTFDPSMVEILLACRSGASLLIAPQKVEALFPNNKKHSVTIWQTTPSLFFQLSNVHIKNKILTAKSPLKILALGGEPLNGIKRLKELKDMHNKTKIFALYGVTEMSCWACVAELDLNKIHTDQEVPLGNCLSETKVFVEPETTSKKSNGKIILVSKTRKCVVLNKPNANYDTINSLKFVDTGDVGEVSNGTIYYRGRMDDVIKRFGNKVNLQFIENTVMLCPRIKTCACVWLPSPKLLVVYYSSESFSTSELSYFLKCKLDDKHWPDRIVRVDNLPMTPHGKISKLVLSQMFEKKQKQEEAITINELRCALLQALKKSLNEHLTYDHIKNKDFFSLGGTSFLAVTISNHLSQTYPDFGKLLLSQLMNERKTIDSIMDLAEAEIINGKPKKKRLKKASETTSAVTSTVSKSNTLIQFIEMWTYNTGKCVDATPSLLQTGVNLYVCVGSHSGRVVTVDAMTGIVVGTINMGSRVEAAVLCLDAEPALRPCGVVGAYDGTVVCFAIETCTELWRTSVGSMVKSKACCCNGFVYVASYDGYIRSIDIVTGEIKSEISISEQGISANLVLAKNEYILAGALSGVVGSLHAPSAALAWRAALPSPVFASPVLYDQDKYVLFAEVSGEIHCRTVEKGIKLWKYSGAKGNIFSSIFVRKYDKAKYQMVFGCHDNHVYSINVKNFQPSLHWKSPMSSAVYATPCGLEDRVLLAASNDGKLCVLSAEYGVILAEYTLPGETFSSPAVYGEYVFIGCRNDLVYSLRCILNL